MKRKIFDAVLLIVLLFSFLAFAFLFRCTNIPTEERVFQEETLTNNVSGRLCAPDNVAREVCGSIMGGRVLILEESHFFDVESTFFFAVLLFFCADQRIFYQFYRKRFLKGFNFRSFGHRCITGYIQLADGKKRLF